MAVPNLVQIRPRGVLGKWVKCNENVIYLFIYTFLGGTRLQVRPPKPPFWGVNRRFQAKRANIESL